ncbi:hypothetical protein EMN47_13400 [Prolixibacteraceae bacterium JC049]|nr:hypothetical protein [Prolixibacteraceae bacterium JC049]
MIDFKKWQTVCCCLLLIGLINSSAAIAQNKYGRLSGSFYHSGIIYQDDSKTNAVVPDDKFGSNNYLKLDYQFRKWSAGVQFEAFTPALIGYPFEFSNKKALATRYLSFDSQKWGATIGHFYEQLGSGLLLRAYEERTLGINTAIDGARIWADVLPFVRVKAMGGNQRKFMDETEGKLLATDIDLDIAKALKWNDLSWQMAASMVRKSEDYTGNLNVPEEVDAFSVRSTNSWKNWSLDAEYVWKDRDPVLVNQGDNKKGNALLITPGYSKKGLGVSLNFRRLENIDFRSERGASGLLGMINYIPALTKQHKYALANLYPYGAQAKGEIGGQFDIYYQLKKGTFLGGKRGAKLAINFSHYKNLKYDENGDTYFLKSGRNLLFSDFNMEYIRKWNKKVKTTFAYVNQTYNKGILEDHAGDYKIKSNILIADVLYKFTRKKALRMEVQHLWSEQADKNWMYGLAEMNWAPRWSVYLSDMYNYGKTERHYYQVGGSYSANSFRFQAGYGRNRAGLQCVGGVCRYVPAYTGLSMQLEWSF